MDFVNKAAAQLSDLFKSMTVGARITAGLLLVVVVVSVGYLFQQQNAGPDAYLMGGEPFAASQLPAMEAAFHKAGLSAYQIDGNRVKVPRGQQSAYMGALADEGALPPNFGSYLSKAVGATNPFLSKPQQQEKLKSAKQEELQLIIRSMKGIESASVLYDIQENRAFGQQALMTASVNVKPAGLQPLEASRVRALKHLVSSSIAGLKPDNVTVTDLNGDSSYPGIGATGTVDSAEDAYGSRKRMYEQDWEQKIRKALSIPGLTVAANVELDTETEHQENSNVYDPKAVVVEQRETTGEKTTESGTPGGQPGLAAQQGGAANQAARLAASAVSKNSDVTSHNESKFAVPVTQKRITHHGLTPKTVTVSVGIPSSYYEKIWRERNPTPAGQEPPVAPANALTDIENAVRIEVEKTVVHLLPPKEPTADKFPPVHVATFQHLAVPAPQLPGLKENALAWVGQYWSTLGMSALALMSLVILRSMVRSSSPPGPEAGAAAATADFPATIPMSKDAEDDEDKVEKLTGRSRLKRRGPGGPSLRDELAEIVKEDPDAAVTILRTWIGNAS